jgi:hypothetical protein
MRDPLPPALVRGANVIDCGRLRGGAIRFAGRRGLSAFLNLR